MPMDENGERVYDITLTIGVRASSEEIAKFKLQEQTRYMTIVHDRSFVDAKMDVCVERGEKKEPQLNP